MVCKIGDWNVKYLSGLVFFCGKRAQVFFKFLNVVLFNIFRLIERLFKVFILIQEVLQGGLIFLVKFVMKVDDIVLEILFDFRVSLLFQKCEFIEVDLNGFERGFLLKKVHEVSLFLLEISDLSGEFDEFLLVGGEVTFHGFNKS